MRASRAQASPACAPLQPAVKQSLVRASTTITPGQTVKLTATVASTTSGTPTQAVSFLDGTTQLGTEPLADGQASLTVALASGTHQLAVQYAGDQNFLPSASTVTASTTVTAASSGITHSTSVFLGVD